MSRGMKFHLASLVLLVGLGSGCFVFEEMDAARKLQTAPGKKAKAEPEAKPNGTATGKKQSAKAQLEQWWESARSINTGEVDESMVSCTLRGATQFMRRDECLARGGSASAPR